MLFEVSDFEYTMYVVCNYIHKYKPKYLQQNV